MHINACLFDRPASVAQSDARLTGDQEVAGWRVDNSLSFLRGVKQGSCQAVTFKHKQANKQIILSETVLYCKNAMEIDCTKHIYWLTWQKQKYFINVITVILIFANLHAPY